MPIYQYDCSCGASVEDIRSIDRADDPKRCAACGRRMRRRSANPTRTGKPGHYTQLIMHDGTTVRAAGAKRRDRER